MCPNHVDPEEMAMRKDLDVIASLNMIGEGGPAFIKEEEEVRMKIKDTNPTEQDTN